MLIAYMGSMVLQKVFLEWGQTVLGFLMLGGGMQQKKLNLIGSYFIILPAKACCKAARSRAPAQLFIKRAPGLGSIMLYLLGLSFRVSYSCPLKLPAFVRMENHGHLIIDGN